MKMRKSILVLCVLIILAALVAIYFNHSRHDKPVASVPEVSAQTETSATNNLPPPQAVAKTDSYQLIVGANPRFNKEQVFLPPTNSVAITNKEQLNLLIKQEGEARQQQKVQQ